MAKLQDELYQLLSSVDAPEMSTSERRMSLSQVQRKLETWAQRHKIPSSSRPSTVDDISLHLAFLGTRMRMLLGLHDHSTGAHPISEEILNDARLSCLLLVTSCNHLDHGGFADRLDHILMRTADSSMRAGTPSSSTSPSQTPASSPFSATSGVPFQSSSPYLSLSTHSIDQTSAPALPPIHRLANLFPIVAVFVLARHILGMGQSAQSQPGPAHQDERHYVINEDVLLLKALLSRFRTALPTVKESPRERMDDVFHRSKLGRITNHLVEIINAIKGPTSPVNVNDANRDDHHSLYAPEPLMASKSSLLLDTYSDASMPDLNYYDGSGELSPSQLDLPLTPFSPQSTWAVTQELMPFPTTTPLLTTANSSYAPSVIPTPPTMAETPFDISQFLHQTNGNSPLMWDSGQGGAHVELQQQQQQQQKKLQSVPEPTAKRKSRKRPRTERDRD